MDYLPLAQLDPDIDTSTATIRGVVTLVWPYSSSKKSFSILLVEPDFRLRRHKGQVRITFRKSCAKALARAELASGNELQIRLIGCKWTPEEASVVRTPGRSIGWELAFDHQLNLQVLQDGKPQTIEVDAASESPQPEQLSTQIAPHTPILVASASSPPYSVKSIDSWSSPAFLKKRTFDTALAPSAYDIFADDAVLSDDRAAKRTKLGRGSQQWRFVARSPSPSPSISSRGEDDADSANANAEEEQPRPALQETLHVDIGKPAAAPPGLPDSVGIGESSANVGRRFVRPPEDVGNSTFSNNAFLSGFTSNRSVESQLGKATPGATTHVADAAGIPDQRSGLTQDHTSQQSHGITYIGKPARLTDDHHGNEDTIAQLLRSREESEAPLGQALEDPTPGPIMTQETTESLIMPLQTQSNTSTQTIDTAASSFVSLHTPSQPFSEHREMFLNEQVLLEESPSAVTGAPAFETKDESQDVHNASDAVFQLSETRHVEEHDQNDTTVGEYREHVLSFLNGEVALGDELLHTDDAKPDVAYRGEYDVSSAVLDQKEDESEEDEVEAAVEDEKEDESEEEEAENAVEDEEADLDSYMSMLEDDRDLEDEKYASERYDIDEPEDIVLADGGFGSVDASDDDQDSAADIDTGVVGSIGLDKLMDSEVLKPELLPEHASSPPQQNQMNTQPEVIDLTSEDEDSGADMEIPVEPILSAKDLPSDEASVDIASSHEEVDENRQSLLESTKEATKEPLADASDANAPSHLTDKASKDATEAHTEADYRARLDARSQSPQKPPDRGHTTLVVQQVTSDVPAEDSQIFTQRQPDEMELDSTSDMVETVSIGEDRTPVFRDSITPQKYTQMPPPEPEEVSLIPEPEGRTTTLSPRILSSESSGGEQTATQEAHHTGEQQNSEPPFEEVIPETLPERQPAAPDHSYEDSEEDEDDQMANWAFRSVEDKGADLDLYSPSRLMEVDQLLTTGTPTPNAHAEPLPEPVRETTEDKDAFSSLTESPKSSGGPTLRRSTRRTKQQSPENAASMQADAATQSTREISPPMGKVLRRKASKEAALSQASQTAAASQPTRRSATDKNELRINLYDGALDEVQPKRRSRRTVRQATERAMDKDLEAEPSDLSQPSRQEDPPEKTTQGLAVEAETQFASSEGRADKDQVKRRSGRSGKQPETETVASRPQRPDVKQMQSRSRGGQNPTSQVEFAEQAASPKSSRHRTITGVDQVSQQLLQEAQRAQDQNETEDVAPPFTNGVRTKHAYISPLSNLAQHTRKVVDGSLALIVGTSKAERAQTGPRDWHMTLYVTDGSMVDASQPLRAVQIFRPTKSALPLAASGDDVILLHSFRCQSQNRKPMLVSTESSGWAVFDKDGAVKNSGPPVEFDDEEARLSSQLHTWWDIISGEKKMQLRTDAMQARDSAKEAAKRKSGRKSIPKPGSMAHELRDGTVYPYTDTPLISDE